MKKTLLSKVIKTIMNNPLRIFVGLIDNKYSKWMSDESFLKTVYYCRTGEKLRLDNPVCFNEKLQWLKLYNQKYEYVQLVDKFEVRKYIENKIGNEYLIPLLGVYENFNDIDFQKLPEKFVLKTTHDSGGVVICSSKGKFNLSEAKRKLTRRMKRNYFYKGREWAYKHVQPRIIIENYIIGSNGKSPNDYKIFCFNGEPKIIQVDFDRFDDHKRNLYDIDWNRLDVKYIYDNLDEKVEAPKYLSKMLNIARVLSANIPFVRVDLYEAENKIYFGELTLYPESGVGKFRPESFNKNIGSWINLNFEENYHE